MKNKNIRGWTCRFHSRKYIRRGQWQAAERRAVASRRGQGQAAEGSGKPQRAVASPAPTEHTTIFSINVRSLTGLIIE